MDVPPPSSAHTEILRLTKVLPALKSPEDDFHKETIEKRILALKREATAAKPLEEQITILKNLVERKLDRLTKLQIIITEAQTEHQTVGAETEQIKADLQVLKQRRLAELDIQPVQVVNPQAQAHILHQEQVIAQMAVQLNQLQTMLLSVQAEQVPTPAAATTDAFQAAPATPFPQRAATGTPFAQQSPAASQAATFAATDAPAPDLPPANAFSLALADAYSLEPLSQASPVIIVDTAQEAAREESRRINRERSPRGVANRDASPDLTRQEIIDPLFT